MYPQCYLQHILNTRGQPTICQTSTCPFQTPACHLTDDILSLLTSASPCQTSAQLMSVVSLSIDRCQPAPCYTSNCPLHEVSLPLALPQPDLGQTLTSTLTLYLVYVQCPFLSILLLCWTVLLLLKISCVYRPHASPATRNPYVLVFSEPFQVLPIKKQAWTMQVSCACNLRQRVSVSLVSFQIMAWAMCLFSQFF